MEAEFVGAGAQSPDQASHATFTGANYASPYVGAPEAAPLGASFLKSTGAERSLVPLNDNGIRRVKLVYFRGAHPNFGDDLNAVLWPKLQPGLFEADDDQGFLGIGTIIGMKAGGVERLHVFSSGVGYSPLDAGPRDRRLWCVRGPLSERLLGAPSGTALTDGAILSPQVLPRATKSDVPVVVPHWESVIGGGWTEACRHAGFTLVDPTGAPGTVIPAIAGAPLVITESLHGAIIADTYGVPWVAIATNGNFSVFKWLDWTLSVQVPLRVHLTPPPNASGLLRFGRSPLGGWGQQSQPGEEAAMAEFSVRARLAASHAPSSGGLRASLKTFLAETGWARRLLGYSPARTAEALRKAAAAPPSLSAPPLRDSLADQMSAQLRRLALEQLGNAA